MLLNTNFFVPEAPENEFGRELNAFIACTPLFIFQCYDIM